MKLARYIYFILLISSFQFAHALGVKARLDSIFHALDVEINKSSFYEQKKDSFIQQLHTAYIACPEESEEKYRLCKRLSDEYLRYNYDSAYCYLKQSLAWAITHKDKHEEMYNRLSIAYFLASTGYETEAYIYMQQLPRESLTSDLRSRYYLIYWKLYSILQTSDRNSDNSDTFKKLATAYSDSTHIYGIKPEMDEYWYNKLDSLFATGNEAACLELLNACEKQTRQYALLSYIMARNYEKCSREDEALIYYAQATIADIRSNTRDHGALPILALKLLERGDVKRAYTYIHYSYKAVTLFNGKLRSMNIIPTLTIIEKVHLEMMVRNQHILHALVASISVMVVLLLILLHVIFRQLKAKNRLKQFNNYLQGLNENIKLMNADLEEVNKKLSISDAIKEKYIIHFVQLCSIYISNLEAYQHKVKKMALSKDVKGILSLAGSSTFFDDALTRLYSSFDDAFLHIYPNFVDSFNALLQEDKHFVLKKNERLTTELRIYALIKLGITDYTQIADFLRCSVNTIYNYRTKLKSRLKASKEELEAFLSETTLYKDYSS